MRHDGSSVRIWRSPHSDFYGDETRHADEAYTTEYLESVADEGFNAVWLRGVLRDLVRTGVFPDLGDDPTPHREALGTVIDRGRETGVGVWLFVQPPQALAPDHPFWDAHPAVEGATRERAHQGEMTAMCVSHPEVRAFLREGTEALSRALPGLEGVILITASELMQHCYTGVDPERVAAGGSTGCERCDARDPGDVVGDIVGCVDEGLDRAGNGGDVVAWNWSWSAYEADPQPGIIGQLPADATLMAGFERGGTKEILGERRPIDEYSLSFAGPSDRFLGAIDAGRDRGMEAMAKLQMATTHELATVPNLPVIGTIYDKVEGLDRHGVDHVMGCWNFGNELCSNTAAFLRFFDADPLPPREAALRGFAADYFPGGDPDGVVDAWATFADAMDHYPFSIPFVYNGPLNHALVRPIEPGPLDGRPVGPSWLREDDRGDDLERSFGPYSLEEIVRGLDGLHTTWRDGAATLQRALADCSDDRATEELNAVRVAGHCFHSGWNLYRAYDLRREWDPADAGAVRAIVRDERDHLREILPVVDADDRVGFHSECQYYMFDADGIRAKIADLDEQLGDR